MAITTYSELKTEIASFLDRDDLTTQVDTFIDLAESRHKRDVRFREILTRSTLAVAQSDRYISLPSDFLDLKDLRLLIPSVTSGRRYYPDFEQLSIDELTKISINDEYRPCAFSVHGDGIELNSAADQAYTLEIFYYKVMADLDDTDTSNELLAKAPEVYLWGALSASAPWLRDDERIQLWETLYQQAVDSLNITEIQNRHGGPMRSKVEGVMPSRTNRRYIY